jgi:6-pyruvoyl-tetrahydropterin synthase related domain
VIAAVAAAVEIPFAFFGMPSGHDVEFHLYSWLEVLSQWKVGILLPRWAALAHFGYGEPRFLFYPPASWTLGATLAALFPWMVVPAIYIWLALVAAGVAMFLLAREFFDYDKAIFAAALYTANPYHLVIVYWRSALAELLASCLIPLLLLLVLRIAEGSRRVIVPLAALLAAAWLTNAPAAVMIHYSLALLLGWLAWRKRSVRPLWIGATAVIVGACLAAFYLLPVIHEQKWINIAEAVSAGSRPQDNFLFTHTADADHNAFNHVVSVVAVFEIAACILAGWMSRRSFRSSFERGALMGGATIVWGSVCAMLLLPITFPLWRFLPKLAFMQFPWRWLLCLSLIFALFAAAAARDWWARIAVCLASLAVVVGVARFVQPPWWDTAADLREMQDNMSDRSGYEGVDEYLPLGADASLPDKNAPRVEAVGAAGAQFEISHWETESKSFTATMPAPGELRLHLFRYPAWRAEVNGRAVETTAQADTGQMLLPVGAGTSQVRISFMRTWDRTAGGWVTLTTLLGAAVWLARESGRTKVLRS